MKTGIIVYKDSISKQYYLKNIENSSIVCIDDAKKQKYFDNNKFGEIKKELCEYGFISKETPTCPLVTILTTFNCNFSCPYCYETVKNNTKYNMDDMDRIIDFVVHQFPKTKYNEIEINFSGGEPLLSFDVLSYFVKQFNMQFANSDISIKYSLTSNGSIFNKEILRFLNENMFSIQISLDGCRELHNRTRHFKNDQGSFDVILSNIETILDNYSDILCSLRVNILDKNLNYCKIIDELNAIIEKGRRDRLFLYFALIDTQDNSDTDVSDDMIDILKELYNLAYYSGYEIPTSFTDGGECMIKDNCSMCITPDCKVFKCYSLVSYSELGGDLEIKSLNSVIKEDSICLEKCVWKGKCYGGCLYRSYINDKSFKKNCRKNLISKLNSFLFLLQLVKLDLIKRENINVENITTTFI